MSVGESNLFIDDCLNESIRELCSPIVGNRNASYDNAPFGIDVHKLVMGVIVIPYCRQMVRIESNFLDVVRCDEQVALAVLQHAVGISFNVIDPSKRAAMTVRCSGVSGGFLSKWPTAWFPEVSTRMGREPNERWRSMKIISLFASTVLSLFGVATAASGQQLAFDHASIMVSLGAPERAALEQAGLQISPDVNRNEGQGTASIAVEFQNSYLELVWVDASVPIKSSLERAAQKFRNRMAWRTSGWCPFGIASRRTTDQELTLPFPTWSWTADWMPKGAEMIMLTPREDTRSPALYIEPRALTDQNKQAALAARFHHPLGVHRITSVRLVSPKTISRSNRWSTCRRRRSWALGKARNGCWNSPLTTASRKDPKTCGPRYRSSCVTNPPKSMSVIGIFRQPLAKSLIWGLRPTTGCDVFSLCRLENPSERVPPAETPNFSDHSMSTGCCVEDSPRKLGTKAGRPPGLHPTQV